MYATSADIKDRFGDDFIKQLADRDNSGSADESLLISVLGAASAEVDTHINNLYTVPLDDVPEIIKEYVLILALSKLFGAGTMPDDIEQQAKDTRLALKNLGEGKTSLSGASRKTTITFGENNSGTTGIYFQERVSETDDLTGFGK